MITNSSILNEIPAIVNQVSKLVSERIITLPFKVSHALAKNASKAREVEADYYTLKESAALKYCETEMVGKNGGKQYKVPKTKLSETNQNELVFIDEESKQKYSDELSGFLNEEVKFDAYKIKEKDLEGISNFPPSILVLMEKYGIIDG